MSDKWRIRALKHELRNLDKSLERLENTLYNMCDYMFGNKKNLNKEETLNNTENIVREGNKQ